VELFAEELPLLPSVQTKQGRLEARSLLRHHPSLRRGKARAGQASYGVVVSSWRWQQAAVGGNYFLDDFCGASPRR